MSVRRQERRGTASQWEGANPILASGEIGVELSPDLDPHRIKIGDGARSWNGLPYAGGGGGDSLSDTGWRDVSGIGDGTDDGDDAILVRRRGNVVTVALDPNAQNYAADNFLYQAILPDGFTPGDSAGANSTVGFVTGDDGGFSAVASWSAPIIGILASGEFVSNDMQSVWPGVGRAEFLTDDAWPTSLPGVQVTPPQVLAGPANTPVGIADTGKRVIGSIANEGDLPDNKGITYVEVQRVGNVVYLSSNGGCGYIEANAVYDAPAGSWPEGFRPDGTVTINLINDQYVSGGVMTLRLNGSWQIIGGDTGDYDDYTWPATSFTTNDAWPTTLPGTEQTPPSVVPVQPLAPEGALTVTSGPYRQMTMSSYNAAHTFDGDDDYWSADCITFSVNSTDDVPLTNDDWVLDPAYSWTSPDTGETVVSKAAVAKYSGLYEVTFSVFGSRIAADNDIEVYLYHLRPQPQKAEYEVATALTFTTDSTVNKKVKQILPISAGEALTPVFQAFAAGTMTAYKINAGMTVRPLLLGLANPS